MFKIKVVDTRKKSIEYPDIVTRSSLTGSIRIVEEIGSIDIVRYVYGDTLEVRRRMEEVLSKYTHWYTQFPTLLQHAMFDELDEVGGTEIEMWPYLGRISSETRDQVKVLYSTGETKNLNRNMSVGFRYVFRRAKTAFSQHDWMIKTLTLMRMAVVLEGITVGHLNPEDFRRFHLAELEKRQEDLTLLVSQMRTNQSPELVKQFLDKVEHVLAWFATAAKANRPTDMQDMRPWPLATPGEVKSLFMENYLGFSPNWQQDHPFQDLTDPRVNRKVKMFRAAFMTDDKVTIRIDTDPQLKKVPVAQEVSNELMVQEFCYGQQSYGSVRLLEGLNYPRFVGATENEAPWNGPAKGKGFVAYSAGQLVPDPELDIRVHTREVTRETAEMFATITELSRPTLVGSVSQNGTPPALYLGDFGMKCRYHPVATSHVHLESQYPEDEVSGHFFSPSTDFAPPRFIRTFLAPLISRPCNVSDIFGSAI